MKTNQMEELKQYSNIFKSSQTNVLFVSNLTGKSQPVDLLIDYIC